MKEKTKEYHSAFEKWIQIVLKGLWVVLMIVTAYFFWMSFQEMRTAKTGIFYILLIILFFAAIFFITKKMLLVKRNFIIGAVIFIVSFITRAAFVLSIRPAAFSDFKMYYEGAVQWAAGDLSFSGWWAIKNFPDMLGFVYWEKLLINVFGKEELWIQLANCVITSLICVVIFCMLCKINRHVGLIAAILYSFYPPNLFLAGVMTNQHLSTLLFYTGFLVLLQKGTYKGNVIRSLLAGALFGGGQLLRPEAPPILLAVGIFMLIKTFAGERRFRQKLLETVFPLCVLAVYFIVTSGFSLYIYNKGMTDTVFASSDKRYKFYVGLDQESQGGFSAKSSETFYSQSDDEARSGLVKDRVDHYLKNPLDFFDLTMVKLKNQYTTLDPSYFWLLNEREQERPGEYRGLKQWYDGLTYPFYTLILLLAALGCFQLRKSGVKHPGALLLWVTYAQLGVYILIEVQGRYRYFIMPAFFILAAASLVMFEKKIHNQVFQGGKKRIK